MSEETVIDLTPLFEESVVRRYEVDAEICNIHGEHRTRTQIIHELVYDVTDESSVDDKKKKEKKDKERNTPREIHTFPLNDDDEYIIPLGGPYGYLMGMLRVAINDLYKDKLTVKTWEGYGLGQYINHGLIVKPEWISVGRVLKNSLEKPQMHMTKTKGARPSMIKVYYDVVAKASVHFTMEFTNGKIPEKLFLSLLEYTQRLGMGPKGRGSLKITKLVKTKG